MFDIIAYLNSSELNFLEKEVWVKYQSVNSIDQNTINQSAKNGVSLRSILLKHFPFYRYYVSGFQPVKIRVPKKCENNYDFHLFTQLIGASQSTKVYLDIHPVDLIPEVSIELNKDGLIIESQVSDLSCDKIRELFGYYFSEQIKLELFSYSSKNARKFYLLENLYFLSKWRERMADLKYEYEKSKEKLLDQINYMFSKESLFANKARMIPIFAQSDKKFNKDHSPPESLIISFLSNQHFLKYNTLPDKMISKIQTGFYNIDETVPFPDGFYFYGLMEKAFIVKNNRLKIIF